MSIAGNAAGRSARLAARIRRTVGIAGLLTLAQIMPQSLAAQETLGDGGDASQVPITCPAYATPGGFVQGVLFRYWRMVKNNGQGNTGFYANLDEHVYNQDRTWVWLDGSGDYICFRIYSIATPGLYYDVTNLVRSYGLVVPVGEDDDPSDGGDSDTGGGGSTSGGGSIGGGSTGGDPGGTPPGGDPGGSGGYDPGSDPGGGGSWTCVDLYIYDQYGNLLYFEEDCYFTPEGGLA